MQTKNKIRLFGITGIPLIKEKDNIAQLIIESLNKNEVSLDNGDILVIAQIIVSKSLGLIKDLNQIKPSKRAVDIYHNIKKKSKKANLPVKNPELIQAILDESNRLIKSEHVLITETKHGFVCADAGIDKSNVEGNNNIALLPDDPDKEARKIRHYIQNKTNKNLAVIISDSFGRSFRIGSVGTAIGVSGISPILDKRGEKDLYEKELKTTIIGQIDSLAAAAQLVMGESDEAIPVVLIKGYNYKIKEDVSINSILREKSKDLFRKANNEDIKKILMNRRSYKLDFLEKPVNIDLVKKCIDLSRWAPSAHNGQFWRYIVLERGKTRKILIDKMNEKLREDLSRDGKSTKFINNKIDKTKKCFLKAPILILLCLDKSDLESYPDKKRLQNEYLLGVQSISTSAIYLLLAMESEGLAGSWYCAPLFAKKQVKRILKLPKEFDPMAFITVGFPKELQKRPKRKNLEEIIYRLSENLNE